MSTSLSSLISCGTKLWLDSVDPALVPQARDQGATGATSNPAIVSDLIQSGRFDTQIENLVTAGDDDETIAWNMTNYLVSPSQYVILPVCNDTLQTEVYVAM